MNAILAGKIKSFDDIAAAQGVAERHVRRLAPLAFLSPSIIAAITNQRLHKAGNEPVCAPNRTGLRQPQFKNLGHWKNAT